MPSAAGDPCLPCPAALRSAARQQQWDSLVRRFRCIRESLVSNYIDDGLALEVGVLGGRQTLNLFSTERSLLMQYILRREFIVMY